jgi:hypothetical protein
MSKMLQEHNMGRGVCTEGGVPYEAGVIAQLLEGSDGGQHACGLAARQYAAHLLAVQEVLVDARLYQSHGIA